MFGLEHGCAHTPTLCFCIGLLGLRYPAGRATEKQTNKQAKAYFQTQLQKLLIKSLYIVELFLANSFVVTTKLSKWSQQSKTETGKHLSLHRNQFNSSIACAKAKSGKNS